jgi:hypothetical protein
MSSGGRRRQWGIEQAFAFWRALGGFLWSCFWRLVAIALFFWMLAWVLDLALGVEHWVL